MAEGDKKESLIKEIYDFIKELYLEEEDKKIEIREKYIKNKFSINRFKREQMQYEKANDNSIGFFNPNTNMLNEKIEMIKQEIEKLSRQQIEEEDKLRVVEKRMDKISILRSLLEEKEEQEKEEKERQEKEEKKKREKEEKERREKEKQEKEEKERREKERQEIEEKERREKERQEIEEKERREKERQEIEEKEREEERQEIEKQNCDASSILKTNEIERQRIGRELHDSTIQNLTGMIHKAEYCRLMIEKKPEEVKSEISAMEKALENTIEELRNIIYDLRPISINDSGLVKTIEKYIHRLEQEYQEITFDVSIKNEEKKVDSIINLNIFRIIQEACNNAIKYGKVSLIFILIEYKEDKIVVSIEDDGIGFNYHEIIKNAEESKRFGLSIMKERAKLMEGVLDIISEEEKGTSIKLIVPSTRNIK